MAESLNVLIWFHSMFQGAFLRPGFADSCQNYFKYHLTTSCYSNLVPDCTVDDMARDHWMIHATSEKGNATLRFHWMVSAMSYGSVNNNNLVKGVCLCECMHYASSLWVWTGMLSDFNLLMSMGGSVGWSRPTSQHAFLPTTYSTCSATGRHIWVHMI